MLLELPVFTPLDLFYPVALFLVASAFWSVFKLRPNLRSSFWFALSFVSGGLAFCTQFLGPFLPYPVKVFLGVGCYNLMVASFVMGIILRANQKPPTVAISIIGVLSTLIVLMFALMNVSTLDRICLVLFTASMLLMTALYHARSRFSTYTDKAIFGTTALLAVLLFVQPLLVHNHAGLLGTGWALETSELLLSFGVVTAVCSVLMATLLVREYVMVIINDLKDIAARDKLTNILNRRGFEERIPDLIEAGQAKNCDVCFIVLDIDHFKAVNDTHGHGFGDEVIFALGRMLAAHKSTEGLAVRLGGEEFLLAMLVSSLDEGRTIAELIRERWSRLDHYTLLNNVRCTASFGVSLLREGEPTRIALARADQALYGAKQTGRNRVRSEEDLQIAKLNYSAQQMQLAAQGEYSDAKPQERPAKEIS